MEKTVKEKIVAISQRMYREALVAATSGNVSAFDRATGKIYITPTSIPYDELTPDDIAVLNLDGTVLEGEKQPSSEWRMHLQVYKHMDDVCAIVHTHSVYATAFAVVRKPIELILIEMKAYLGGKIPLAEFAQPGTEELGNSVVRALSQGSTTCLLSNHGAVAVGQDLDDAYTKAVYMEDAAKIYCNAKMLGVPVVLE